MKKKKLTIFVALAMSVFLGLSICISDQCTIPEIIVNISDVNYENKLILLDNYFTSDAIFISKGKKTKFAEAKQNLESRLESGQVTIGKHALYTTRVNYNIINPNCSAIGWIITKDEGSIEYDIKAKFKRVGLFGLKISEIQSDDDAFGVLFFNK